MTVSGCHVVRTLLLTSSPFTLCCAASYFLAGATITGGTVTVEGCGSESLQGDVRFAEVMGLMGAKVEWQPYSITITGRGWGM